MVVTELTENVLIEFTNTLEIGAPLMRPTSLSQEMAVVSQVVFQF